MTIEKLHFAFLLCATFFVGGCSQESSHNADRSTGGGSDARSLTQSANAAGSAPSAPTSLAQCKACHSVSRDGGNGVGPRLYGIVGKKAGFEAGYTYSDAIAQSGLTWNPEQLDEFLQSPGSLVPGTKMPFAGIKDPEERKEIIEYLSNLKM